MWSFQSKVSPSFIDTACTMGSRVSCLQGALGSVEPLLGFWPAEVLTDKLLADLLLKADESDKKAFSHWSKFQILIQKGRTSEGIRWLFLGVPLGSCLQKWIQLDFVQNSFDDLTRPLLHCWGMMDIPTDGCPPTSFPQGIFRRWPANWFWRKRVCCSWSWRRLTRTTLSGHHKWSRSLVMTSGFAHHIVLFTIACKLSNHCFSFLRPFVMPPWTTSSSESYLVWNWFSSNCPAIYSNPRATSGDQTWRAGWPSSAESLWMLIEDSWLYTRLRLCHR